MSVARADEVTGPYVGNPANPVLTHRHLGRDHPIVGTGHADLVQLPDGGWWAVVLAMRPYGGYHYNLGRETFVVPVVWQDGWPVFAPGTGQVTACVVPPPLAPHPWPAQPARDEFRRPDLDLRWNALRGPASAFAAVVGDRGGCCRCGSSPGRSPMVARRRSWVAASSTGTSTSRR